MKTILLFLSLIFVTPISAQTDGLNWLTDFESVIKKSKKSKKPILMYFTGSDWCAPCAMLHEDFFSTPEFKKQSSNLLLLKVDIPRWVDIVSENQLKANKKLLDQYNKKGGFPYLVALDHTKKI